METAAEPLPPTPDSQPSHAAEPVTELETVAAGLQASKTGAAQRRRSARDARSGGGLLLIRVLAALGLIALATMSYIAARMHNPPDWLQKWGMFEVVTKTRGAYKAEMVALILLGLVSLLAFIAQSGVSQFFAFVMGMSVMGIEVGNIIDLDLPHDFITFGMTQNEFITSWILLGLALISVLSSFSNRATPRHVAGIIVTGAVITGGTVAIISALAPSATGLASELFKAH